MRAGLAVDHASAKPRPYRIKTVSLGGIVGGGSLEKALQLADALEDEELARKLHLRK